MTGASHLAVRRSLSGPSSAPDMRKPYAGRGLGVMAQGWVPSCHRPAGQLTTTPG